MMKKTILFVAIILLMLSGCSKKKPKPTNANEIASDTISVDESSFGNGGGVAGNGGPGYNSSSDGMRSIYFAFDQYTLDSDMQSIVSFNAGVLGKKLGSAQVKLEGNCDEFGTDEYNYALGLKRAKAVKDSLVMQGVNGSKIVLVSYGESNPKCSTMSDSCYAQNRRVDLHILR
ncbi:Outer membrane lipoprotein omp16 precursor [hydrothermal vent metagenome]|uniref:Outer membrane lipoprotein omp16 n=1 Tax=hydrothermal vent metagenome TaxID=652676 RepID=A0A1W1C6S0_9ZZZZ